MSNDFEVDDNLEVLRTSTNAECTTVRVGTILTGDKLGETNPLPQCGKHGAWYGFHDCRRAFATCNAADMDLFELQKLMQHKSLATTQIYVNMVNKLNAKVKTLYVSPFLVSSEIG